MKRGYKKKKAWWKGRMKGRGGHARHDGRRHICKHINCSKLSARTKKNSWLRSNLAGHWPLECTLIAHEDWLFCASVHGPKHVTELEGWRSHGNDISCTTKMKLRSHQLNETCFLWINGDAEETRMKQACVGNVCIYGFSPRVYTTLDENRPNIEWDSKGRNQTILPMPLTETNSVWKKNQKVQPYQYQRPITAKIPSQLHPHLSLFY
jgi:hypothetical protein